MTSYSFQVLIPEGLHARPCAKIIEILKPFEDVEFCHNQVTVRTSSLLELLLLKIGYNSSVTLRANTPLPPLVVEELQNLFSNA